MNRRLFLAHIATAGAAVGLSPAVAAAAAPNIPAYDIAAASEVAPAAGAPPVPRRLDRWAFIDALEAHFVLDGETARRVELLEIRDAPSAEGLDQFSVLFREVDATRHPAAAGIHTLTHPAHGEFQLHLEPVTDSPLGLCYRASLCLLS